MDSATITMEAAVSAWFQAIAEQGWQAATLHRAAALSGLSSGDIIRLAGDKIDAVLHFQRTLARDVAVAAGGEGSVRDRLFDGLMRGFDLLQAQRHAILKLRESRDPGLLVLAFGQAGPGLRLLSAAAGCDTSGVRGHFRLAALSALGAKAFETWRSDKSPDMASTMAELDRLLAKAEQAETEGFSLGLLGLSGLPNPFDRAHRSSPDPRSE